MKFSESEIKTGETMPAGRGFTVPKFGYPISMREEYRKAILEKKPMWMNTSVEVRNFTSKCVPDNVARGFVFSGETPLKDEEKGGKDMFGIEWVYVPVVGGSMEKDEKHHILEDVNDWKEKLVFPDIDSWDWETSAKENKEFLSAGYANMAVMLNGFGFERLISFMGFENAAMALMDEDQEDALDELLDALADLYCRLVDKYAEYYDLDAIQIHDDWGSQRAPFFNSEIGRRFFVPRMKKVTDRIHSHGLIADLHSCGCLYNSETNNQVENIIAGGWDVWSLMTNINPTQEIFEKYGDRIIISVEPEPVDFENDSEEVQRQKARDFVKFAVKPGKVCTLARGMIGNLNTPFGEELYKASRIAYDELYG